MFMTLLSGLSRNLVSGLLMCKMRTFWLCIENGSLELVATGIEFDGGVMSVQWVDKPSVVLYKGIKELKKACGSKKRVAVCWAEDVEKGKMGGQNG